MIVGQMGVWRRSVISNSRWGGGGSVGVYDYVWVEGVCSNVGVFGCIIRAGVDGLVARLRKVLESCLS